MDTRNALLRLVVLGLIIVVVLLGGRTGAVPRW